MSFFLTGRRGIARSKRLRVSPFSDLRRRKKEPYRGVLAAFPGSGWGKLRGKKQLDLEGLTSH